MFRLCALSPLFSFCRNSAETESPKVEILGFVDEESEEGPVTLRPNRFRPEAGIRKRLRSRLHEVLEDQETLDSESADRDNTKEQSTSTRLGALFILCMHVGWSTSFNLKLLFSFFCFPECKMLPDLILPHFANATRL